METGRVRIEKFLAVEDAGRIINPLIADGQVHGGIAQGIGNALFEEIVYDAPATSRPQRLPTTCRRPRAKFRRSNCTTSKRRRMPPSPAPRAWAKAAPSARRRPMLNAVNDALSPFGVSIDEMPATPQRIRAALRAFRNQGAAGSP